MEESKNIISELREKVDKLVQEQQGSNSLDIIKDLSLKIINLTMEIIYLERRRDEFKKMILENKVEEVELGYTGEESKGVDTIVESVDMNEESKGVDTDGEREETKNYIPDKEIKDLETKINKQLNKIRIRTDFNSIVVPIQKLSRYEVKIEEKYDELHKKYTEDKTNTEINNKYNAVKQIISNYREQLSIIKREKHSVMNIYIDNLYRDVQKGTFNIVNTIIPVIHNYCTILNSLDQYNIICAMIKHIKDDIDNMRRKGQSTKMDVLGKIKRFKEHIDLQIKNTNRR